jgi:hypothetical protein
MFQKKSEDKHQPSIGMARDRQVGRSLWLVGRNVARRKKSRNLRLILNSGFFVRGCRIGKTNFSRDATLRERRR